MILTNRSFGTILIYLAISIYTFMLIYAPRFMANNTLHVLFILAIFTLPFVRKDARYILVNTKLSKFCVTFFLLTLYSCIIAYIGGEYVKFENLIVVPIELGCCVLLIASILRNRDMNQIDLFNIILIVGALQSLICVAMIAIPSFRDTINVFRSQFWNDKYIGWANTRMLGLADNLLHTTPIVQAMISLFFLLKSEKNMVLYIFVITTLISALLNSRTSFILWIILFLYYTFNAIRRGKIETIFIIGGVYILFSTMILFCLDENASSSIEYFYDGMNEIGSAVNGKQEGFFKSVDNYIVFPNGVDLFLGIGIDTYSKINNPYYISIRSDYGFINNIWTYGFIGTIIMIRLYYVSMRESLKLKSCNGEFIYIVLLLSFIVGHFKGIITSYNDFTVLLLLFVVSIALPSPNKNMLNEKN